MIDFDVLMAAALSGNLALARLLLDRGADPNTRATLSGQTALMWAASQQHHEIVRLLIERGADVRARSAGGFTPRSEEHTS